MSQTLKIGTRVHVLKQKHLSRYLRGDKGTVTDGPHQFGAGRRYYFVAMDRDASPTHPVAVLTEDEIEPDLEPEPMRRGR
jgi:hypothetical protein